MVRVSNFVVGFLNTLSLLLGLGAIAGSLYVHFHGGTECQKVLQYPLLITGLSLSIISLLGLIGSCCRVNFMLKLYLVAMISLIVGLIVFTVFVFLVTNAGAGKAVSGLGFKEYRLRDYSNWLQKQFVNGKNWDGIRSCLVDAQVCRSLGKSVHVDRVDDFYNKNLSPIQSGCCKPPISCGFRYNNATFWTVTESSPAVKDRDCITWSNHQQTLCYDCNSCKAGVLANINKEGRILAIVNIVVIILLIVIYSIGCCAERNNKEEDMYGRNRGNA